MPRPPTDAEFTAFVRARWASLYRTAYLLLGDAAEAEDLVQTALAKTYAKWSTVRDVDAAVGFARTTLVNTATSWFRRRSWRNELPTDALPEQRDGAASDLSDRPAVVAALVHLPPRQRAVVVLRFYDDLSVAQVAAALGVSEGTVKSQTSDALTKLRVLLGDDVVPQTTATSTASTASTATDHRSRP